MHCPHCTHDKIMRFSDGIRYRCHKCRKDFTIKTGTQMHNSKVTVEQWSYSRKLLKKYATSSKELALHIGVTQKTAHRILKVLKTDV